MVTKPIKCIIALVSVLVLSLALAACTQAADTATEAQKANRAYMSQVNETMNSLSSALGSFVDAVSRDDVVNMRAQADNAYQLLDKLEQLEAPEELSDIKDGYVEGTTKLREALDGYIALYTEAKNSATFDWSKFDARLASIQSLYDQGIAALEKADAAAAAKN